VSSLELPVSLLDGSHFFADFVVPICHHVDLIVTFLQFAEVFLLVSFLRLDLFLQQLNHSLMLFDNPLELDILFLS
jgi:hypothetical protein